MISADTVYFLLNTKTCSLAVSVLPTHAGMRKTLELAAQRTFPENHKRTNLTIPELN